MEAHADRKAIREYIAEHVPIAALAFDELFALKAARLIDRPGLGQRGRIFSTQELVMHKHYLGPRSGD